MTKEQILKKAIEKAVKNGFEFRPGIRRDSDFYNGLMKSLTSSYCEYFIIIFSHSFAKAFWGEKKKNGYNHYGTNIILPEYIWELIEMVQEKDPLKYLEKFL